MIPFKPLLDARIRAACDRVSRLAAAVVDAPCSVLALDHQDDPSVLGYSDAAGRTTGADTLPPSTIERLRRSAAVLFPILNARDELLNDPDVLSILGAGAIAAIPIRSDARMIGILCAIEGRPRGWLPEDLRALRRVAESARPELELRTALVDGERGQRARDEALDLHHAVLEASPDAVLVVDADGGVVDCNRAFATMWGIPEEVLATRRDEALLEHILEQVAEPDRFLARVRELYARPTEPSSDRIRFRDGRIVDRRSQPLYIDGSPAGRVWTFRIVDQES